MNQFYKIFGISNPISEILPGILSAYGTYRPQVTVFKDDFKQAGFATEKWGGIIHKIVEAAGIQSSDAVYEVKRKKPTNGGHQLYDNRKLHVGAKTKCHIFGSWNRTEKNTSMHVCWTCCFLHLVSNQCHMIENPPPTVMFF